MDLSPGQAPPCGRRLDRHASGSPVPQDRAPSVAAQARPGVAGSERDAALVADRMLGGSYCGTIRCPVETFGPQQRPHTFPRGLARPHPPGLSARRPLRALLSDQGARSEPAAGPPRSWRAGEGSRRPPAAGRAGSRGEVRFREAVPMRPEALRRGAGGRTRAVSQPRLDAPPPTFVDPAPLGEVQVKRRQGAAVWLRACD